MADPAIQQPRLRAPRLRRLKRLVSGGLWVFLVRRLALALFILFSIYTLIFVLMRVGPGDPADHMMDESATPEQKERLAEVMGLNDPILQQFGERVGALLVGDFGNDKNGDPVWDTLSDKIMPTIWLLLPAVLLAFAVGVILGRRMAWKHGGWIDNSLTVVGLIFYTMFVYWLAVLMIQIFAYNLNWFFDGQMYEETHLANPYDSSSWPLDSAPALWSWVMQILPNATLRHMFDFLYHLLLPTLVLFIHFFAFYMLYMRANMLETLRDDYVQTARGKGVPEWAIRKYHAGRNALLPVVTLFVLQVSTLVSGSVLIESAFDWHGLGYTIFDSITKKDYNLVQGSVILLSGIVLIGTIVADLIYAIIDPRVKLRG